MILILAWSCMYCEIFQETVEIIEAVLCVDTIKLTVAGSNLVGSFTIFNNLGGMVSTQERWFLAICNSYRSTFSFDPVHLLQVHHLSSDEEMDELSILFERPLAAGTVNCGSEDIGFGMVVNDSGAIYGSNTTARELCVIESVFKPWIVPLWMSVTSMAFPSCLITSYFLWV